MKLSHKIRMYPTVKQARAIRQACGVARYTYNWALAEWNKQYVDGGKPNANELKRLWNSVKPDWVYESPKDANQQPFSNLKSAWSRYFKDLKVKGKTGRPSFKHKGAHDSFYVSNDLLALTGKVVKLSRLGRVKLAEELRFKGKIMSGTVSYKSGKYWLSVAVDTDKVLPRTGTASVGLDLGLKHFATLSTGEIIDSPKPLKKYLCKVKYLSRQTSRKVKGSKNHAKAKCKLARVHEKAANIRNDFIHKTTTKLCRENQAIVIEDLAVRNMQRNHKLAQAISDQGWGEFRRQLDYKSKIYGNSVIAAPRFYPSSKTCSGCGAVKSELSLGDRVFNCSQCGASLDRDLNAARNLYTLGSRGIQACGPEVRPTEASWAEAGTKTYSLVGTN